MFNRITYSPLAWAFALACSPATPWQTESEGLTPLSNTEAQDLQFAREEEKLARDVYKALVSADPTFEHIVQSEQRHMDAVLSRLEVYDIPDPAAATPPGVFKNADLQRLYEELTKKAAGGLMAALEVGATIEDLDLNDLQRLQSASTHEDVLFVYDNLARGSRNHLRAFTSRLSALGGTYEPAFISASEFETIVNAPMEKGPGFHGGGRCRHAQTSCQKGFSR